MENEHIMKEGKHISWRLFWGKEIYTTQTKVSGVEGRHIRHGFVDREGLHFRDI